MSVLIKDMKMPDCCDVCIFSDWSNLHQTAACKICEYDPCFDDFSREHLSKRADFCPLVEITSKHGDLIDKQNLLKELVYIGDRPMSTGLRFIRGAQTVLEAEGEE